MSIVCLCASHINNLPKIKMLENMIISWNNENAKTIMILSISCIKNLKSEFEKSNRLHKKSKIYKD